ncbi:MAG: Zn-dependent protease with chaperone function [Oceanicoccus sp.]
MSSLKLNGFIYGGELSNSEAVTLLVDVDGAVYRATEQTSLCHFSQLNVSSRVGNTARHLTLPDGSRFESRNNVIIDQLCQQWQSQQRGKMQGLAHKLEHNLKLVWASVISVLAVTFITVVFGIPLLSKQITDWLPLSVDQQLAEQSLPRMDQTVFKPTKLKPERQVALSDLFAQLSNDSERELTLLFRDGESIGANAFALPDGRIILTDQLVALADNDDMIASILLHEIGHVEYRHSVQNLVRQAGLSALILAVTGDVNTASTLVLMLPTVLMQSQYSQEFEWQADGYALGQMQARDIDRNYFADMMEKLSESRQPKDQELTTDENIENEENDNDLSGKKISLNDYFASHPPSKKRIERFRQDGKTPTE